MMEHFTAINIIFVFVGLLLYNLIHLEKIAREPGLITKAQVKFWFLESLPSTLISMICGLLSLYFVDIISPGLGITINENAIFYQFHALGSGYLGRDIILKFLDQKFKKKE